MAIRPVVVSFQAEGVRDVTRSFQTIANAAANAEKASIRSHDRVANQAIKSYSRTSDAKKRETKAAISDDEKLAQSKRKLSQEIEAIERRQSDRRMREIERQLKADIKADDARAKSAQKASDQIARIHAKESAAAKRIGDGIGRTVGGSVRGVIGGASRLAGTAMAVGGGFSIIDSLQDTIANRGKAAEIALNSGQELKRDALLDQAHRIAISGGFKASTVLGAIDRFGAVSGDYKSAPEVIGQIADLANATGGDIDQLAEAAGSFQANGGNAAMTQKWLRVSAGMGRAGSVDVRDLAQYGAKVTASSGQFSNQDDAFIQLSAMTQMARKAGGADDPAVATTAVQRFADDIWKNEGSLKLMGVKTRDASGRKLGDAQQIMTDAISATRGDRGKLGAAWKIEGIKAVEGYRQAYNNAAIKSKADGGNDVAQDAAGRAAIKAAFDDMRKAVIDEKQVKVEAAKRMEEADKKLIAVFEKLKIEVGDKLAPKFMELIPVLEKAIPAFTEMLDFATKNPLASVAILMGAAVTKDIAAAGIGKGIQVAISGALTGATVPAVGALGSLTGAAVSLTAAILGTKAAVDYALGDSKNEQDQIFLGGANVDEARRDFERKVADGSATPADYENAKRYITSAASAEDKRYEDEKGSGTGIIRGAVNYYGGLEDIISSVVGKGVMPSGGEYTKVMDEQAANIAKGHERATKSIEQFAAVVEKFNLKNGNGKGDANSPARINSLASPKRGGHQ